MGDNTPGTNHNARLYTAARTATLDRAVWAGTSHLVNRNAWLFTAGREGGLGHLTGMTSLRRRGHAEHDAG